MRDIITYKVTGNVWCVHTTQTLESSTVFLYVFAKGPSCTAVKIQPLHPVTKWKTQGFLFGVDTLDITNNCLIVKEKCEEWSEENRDCQSLWATCRYSIEHERTSLRSLPSLLWLMFRQKDAPLYNGCWQSSCWTGFCFDSAQCFQRTAVPLFFLFLWWGRSFLQCPSPCLIFPSGFLWFLRQRVFGLQLLDTSMAQSKRPVVYCTCETLRNRQVRPGRSIKYIYPERFKGSSGQDKTDQTFPDWKYMTVYLEKSYYCPFYGPE